MNVTSSTFNVNWLRLFKVPTTSLCPISESRVSFTPSRFSVCLRLFGKLAATATLYVSHVSPVTNPNTALSNSLKFAPNFLNVKLLLKDSLISFAFAISTSVTSTGLSPIKCFIIVVLLSLTIVPSSLVYPCPLRIKP